jgi:hypothetical protein
VILALVVMGASLGLLVAGAAIYFLAPPPTSRSPQAIEEPGGSSRPGPAESDQGNQPAGDTR